MRSSANDSGVVRSFDYEDHSSGAEEGEEGEEAKRREGGGGVRGGAPMEMEVMAMESFDDDFS